MKGDKQLWFGHLEHVTAIQTISQRLVSLNLYELISTTDQGIDIYLFIFK
jgi:hypothetical protein